MNTQISTFLNKILDSCTQCGKCQEECLFLKEFEVAPWKFAESLIRGEQEEDPALLYSCNLCGICEEICPESINLGNLFLLLRQERMESIKQGKESFSALELIKAREEWSSKGGFLYSKGEKCESAFFPGCTLSGYNPHLVLEAYAYLRKHHNPSTGIILNCCGAPFEGLGEKDELKNILQTICSQIKKIGASNIIMACPTCYRVFKRYLSQYKVSTLYEIMEVENEGLPARKENAQHQFYLFHSCSTRHEEGMQRAVCSLIEKMGYQIQEEEDLENRNKCCGMGGMVGVTNPVLSFIIGENRTEGITPHDIVTYCAACREALVQYRPTVHVLDLVFNPNWKHGKEDSPLEDKQMRENCTWLKSKLEKE
jgi:Fe-S oxidoreductase